MLDEQYYIGIDGGGTSCRARLANTNGDILSEAQAGSANIFQNADIAWQSLCNSITEAFATAKIPMPPVSQCNVVAGLAGAGFIETGSSIRADEFVKRGQGFNSFQLLTDAQIACLGAHGGNDGAIYIIGTGAIGMSLQNGNWTRIGGWGFPLHDMGGGAWLGQQAIRAAVDQRDGIIAASELTREIWAIFEQQPEQLVRWSQTATPSDYGKLAPQVLNAFAQKDVNAEKIVAQQIQFLTQQIEALAQSDQAICLMGGLAQWVLDQLPLDLKNRISMPKSDALQGALSLALKSR